MSRRGSFIVTYTDEYTDNGNIVAFPISKTRGRRRLSSRRQPPNVVENVESSAWSFIDASRGDMIGGIDLELFFDDIRLEGWLNWDMTGLLGRR